MKVSLNTVKQYTTVDLSVDMLVHKINSQLGGVEAVIDLAAKYKDPLIVKIIEAEQHPNADRLKVTKIDDGGVTPDVPRDDRGYVQVVCGAPNARAGIMAVWLPPASTVPATYEDADPFVLSARDLRGVTSQGMLAAADELALNGDHDGILEIDPDEWSPKQADIRPGANFAAVFGLDDTVLDIENKMFTHRPDCFGVLGVAREIAGIQHIPFTSPEWYIRDPAFQSGEGLTLNVTNDAPDVVPRFMAVAIKGVNVKPSPLWLQCELIRLGAKPINNVVDVTNYIMLLTAQPTHAYDYDKLGGQALGARRAQAGEKITLLNHKSYELDAGDIVITDGEGPVGLAGIMGGGDSEVSDDTKNIVLECATFDMYALRKTSMRHGVFTDALTRFNKGQSPLQNPYILQLLISSLADVAGGDIASHIFDQSSEMKPALRVSAGVTFINERLGTSLAGEEMTTLLTNVEFDVKLQGDTLSLVPPFWRTDIELPEDIVEEVGRLYGFDALPRELPRRSIAPVEYNPVIQAKRSIRHALSRSGANEVLTYSFVHEKIMRQAGQDPAEAFRLSNALSPDLQFYRLSLTPSLLAKINPNIRTGHDAFTLFELGKAHGKSEIDHDGLPKEFDRIAAVYAAKSSDETAFFTARRYVATIIDECVGDARLEFRPLSSLDAVFASHRLFGQMLAPYARERTAVVSVDGRVAGIVGEFTSDVMKDFKLPRACAGFELFLSAFPARPAQNYQPLSRYPSVSQDISLRVAAGTAYEAVEACVQSVIQTTPHATRLTLLAIYRPEISESRTMTFRLRMVSQSETLKDNDMSKLIDAIAEQAAQKIDAERV